MGSARANHALAPKDGQVGLKLGDSLVVVELHEEKGTALLRNGQGSSYELHTDECHAQAVEQLVGACRQAVNALESNDPTPSALRQAKEALREALAGFR
jgi:hypothetical protein